MLLKNLRFRYIVLFLLDNLSVLFFCWLVFQFSASAERLGPWLGITWEFLFVDFLCVTVLYINELYKLDSRVGLIDLILKVIVTVVSITFILTIYYLSFPANYLSEGKYLYVMFLTLISTVSWRIFLRWFFYKLDLSEKILILGSGSLARVIIHELLKKDNVNYKIEGLIDDEKSNQNKKILGHEVIGNFKDLFSIINKRKIDKIIVALNQRRERLPLTELLNCKLQGTNVLDTPDFYEQLTGKILIKDLRPSWLIFSSGFRKTEALNVAKRFLDIICSSIGIIIFLPILIVSAIIIKLDSKGPVFFTQERIGEYGKPFNIYKFRSMTSDAEKESGPTWAEVNDHRITRFGQVLRKMRIDEIPQMINVLKGEMSFVGPRPERDFFIKQLQKRIPYYTQRLMVKPGITGWSAVNAQYSSTIEAAVEKLQYDLYYVKNMSVTLDLMIMLKTVQIILSGKGSR